MTRPDASVAVPRRPAARWRLGVGSRRAVLIVHIVSAGSWFGTDVAMAVVIGTTMTTDDPLTRASCLQTLEIITVWPLLTAGLVCLLSGIALGLGSKWGLVRYWWVTLKLVLNLVLTALVLVALRPEVTRLAEQARRSMTGGAGVVRPVEPALPADGLAGPAARCVHALGGQAVGPDPPVVAGCARGSTRERFPRMTTRFPPDVRLGA